MQLVNQKIFTPEIMLLFVEYYPRKIEEKLDKWIKRREAILIRGPRQSGKTTLLLHLKEKLGGSYVTLEDEDMLRAFEENPKAFASRFKGNLFLDEAQYSKGAGRSIKLIYDLFPNLKLFVTGSGSFDVKVEIGKYLVGRAIYFDLLPLDFEEFLSWKAKDLLETFRSFKEMIKDFLEGKKVEVEVVFEREFRSLLGEFLTFGGFPAIVKENDEEIKKELLKNLYRTYLEKDVFFFFNIRHLEKFNAFMKYLASSIGHILEISSMSSDLKIDYKTLENYISILVNTYIIRLVSPFHKSLVTELKKAKKVYFVDIGLRNAAINNFSPLENRADKGYILENFILGEIAQLGQVRYWRTTGKAEVDFVLDFKGKIVPIEVKSFGRVSKSFLSFLKAYKPDRAIIFNEREFGMKELNGTKILLLPPWFI